ncbi:hypothetical protein, conserved [Trypanosoma brucei gambiense DAL972]|uniref:Cilia- and flagella-associated protein 91 n=1 Tax=Trypanosoma brucei gambiense (strain MHOM/CI/86/DAL972) TaxID=679716 RepID=D0A691_TRYB9|nr:hypothetical protein, conserved [Trypanosoma brucei gambiense DAL972]CBH17192.1 hypothetical protein, conserved [Trypanosoma brucei gambiense DAL972]|eukprot:XP_011779456.1 hypothetical protein, conserved [Trypanosoma brucei gambiense DAL972]
MYYRTQQKPASVLGANGFTAEVGGRDRVRYFRPPVEVAGVPMRYSGIDTVRFSATAPTTPNLPRTFAETRFDRPTSMAAGLVGPPHHLPSLPRRAGAAAPHPVKAKSVKLPPQRTKRVEKLASTIGTDGKCDAAMQTVFRENEAQTLPYTPNYYIPEGGDPNPQVLGLMELHWNEGLPAGKEEVELIQRLRRRRAVEASLLDETSKEAKMENFCKLYDLEVKEREEREQHFENLRKRRLDQIHEALQERERARDELNRQRLEKVKEQRLANLQRVIEQMESKRVGMGRKALAEQASKAPAAAGRGLYAVDPIETFKRKPDLIQTYARRGTGAVEPQLCTNNGGGSASASPRRDRSRKPLRNYRQYDIQPAMLKYEGGIAELEANKIPKIQQIAPNAFAAPENHAINSLPSLYQRREATRVVEALEYVHAKIHKSDTPAETIRVLELYRATPRPQRPDTPTLELEGDVNEAVEESCTLLQRLLRGRAVQNDFFDGKERCRGLIEELQAASNAKYAERSAEEKQAEAEEKMREAIADSIGNEAQGDIICDTLDYLFHEMTRQQDLLALEALRHEAEAVRAEREAREAELRAQERILHDKEAVQYAAYVRAIEDIVECYSHDLYTTVAEECAMEEAIEAECQRLEQLPPPTSNILSDPEVAENLVCDVLDNFVLPAVIDMVRMKPEELDRKAPAAAAAGFRQRSPNEKKTKE